MFVKILLSNIDLIINLFTINLIIILVIVAIIIVIIKDLFKIISIITNKIN